MGPICIKTWWNEDRRLWYGINWAIGFCRSIDTIWKNGAIHWRACENYKDRFVYLCLDGLSLDRHRNFFRKLIELPISFTDSFEQAVEFQKALSRVIEMSGPLHMPFHMLQSIYILYDPLLLVSKECVDWKKLKMNKVSDNYRLACSLAFIVHEELTRLLTLQYLNTLSYECTSDINIGIGEGHDMMDSKGIQFARGFRILCYIKSRNVFRPKNYIHL